MDENRIELPGSASDTFFRIASVVVAIAGAVFIMYLLGGNVPEPAPSLYGVYEGKSGTAAAANADEPKGNRENMPNRRPEVDKALADVDFSKNTYQIEFKTTLGKIKLNLYPDIAPEHCKNIIGLTKIGYYDGIIFHRVIKDFVCQAGCPLGTGTGGPGYTIKAEFNDKLHVAGTLSMARTNDPNSAGSQFFLCLGRVPHLDKQYTVFGQTADDESLAVVMQFNKTQTGPGDRPNKEVKIETAKVIVTPK